MNARKIGLGVLVGVCLLVSVAKAGEPDVSLADVTRWVGTGSSYQAGILVQWNDETGTQQELWGYRWDDAAPAQADPTTPTGQDVMMAAAGELGLNIRIGLDGGYGLPFLGIGYDADGTGFSVTDASGAEVTFADGVDVATVWQEAVWEGGVETEPGKWVTDFMLDIPKMSTVNDPADRYAEGWEVGFWSLYEGTIADGWVEAAWGAAFATIDDGDWLGWNFSATGWDDRSAPTATVPEPATMSLLALGGVALLKRRKK